MKGYYYTLRDREDVCDMILDEFGVKGEHRHIINGNGFVFGVPGSGKSFFCKMEMGSVFLSGDDEIIVIDPMNEYFDIAQTYGGTVVNMYVKGLEVEADEITTVGKIALTQQ